MIRREPRDPHLWELTKAAVREGKRLLDELRERNAYIGEYLHYPILSRLENGFPSVHHQLLTRKTDYTDAFGLKASSNVQLPGPYYAFEGIQPFVEVIEYVLSHEDLRAYMGPPSPYRTDRKLVLLATGLFITEILNRYLHLYDVEGDIDEKKLLPIFLQMETPPFEKELPIEILVPIVLTGFDVEEPIELSSEMRIEKLSDQDHLARVPYLPMGSAVNNVVLSAATHALVLTGRRMKLECRWSYPYQDVNTYPLDEIECFFEALRLVTGYDTGYAQVVIRPLGWAIEYTASLPPLLPGPTIRQYPQQFDDRGWIGERPTVTDDDVRLTGQVATALVELEPGERVALAARRFSFSKLRVREDDRIIDLCIALEALAGDEEGIKAAIHRLARRVAAIQALSQRPILPPLEVYTSVRKIFNYRNLVVHAKRSRRAEEDFTTSIPRLSEPVSPTALAEFYVRIVLLALLEQPRWQEPSVIDAEIMPEGL
jgi:hypothetical protein